jgi:hypothetical protein
VVVRAVEMDIETRGRKPMLIVLAVVAAAACCVVCGYGISRAVRRSKERRALSTSELQGS